MKLFVGQMLLCHIRVYLSESATMYLEAFRFSTSATAWGCDHEHITIKCRHNIALLNIVTHVLLISTTKPSRGACFSGCRIFDTWSQMQLVTFSVISVHMSMHNGVHL